MSKPGGDVPVDGAYVVTHLILPYLGELDAPPFEGALVLAGKEFICLVFGFEMKSLNFSEQFLGNHLRGPLSAPTRF
jgi:hypothetical protein